MNKNGQLAVNTSPIHDIMVIILVYPRRNLFDNTQPPFRYSTRRRALFELTIGQFSLSKLV